MRIITISREFGSGGREIGKRLADAFHIPYYDHEVIDMIDERHGFDKNHGADISEKDLRVYYLSTIGHRLMAHRPVCGCGMPGYEPVSDIRLCGLVIKT